MYLILDTETNGLPFREGLPFGKFYDYKKVNYYDTARVVQFSMMLCNEKMEQITLKDFIIKRDDFNIDNHRFHKITNEISDTKGIQFKDAVKEFYDELKKVDYIVCHNANFDMNVMKSELYRYNFQDILDEMEKKKIICTMEQTKQIVKARNGRGIKSPSLEELYIYCCKEPMINQHNSKYDVINLHKALKILYDDKLLF